MTYFKCINKSESPTKLFVNELHEKEGLTTLSFLKNLNGFKNGKIIICNFDESEYISTLKEDY
jgi:hypothetical protein